MLRGRARSAGEPWQVDRPWRPAFWSQDDHNPEQLNRMLDPGHHPRRTKVLRNDI